MKKLKKQLTRIESHLHVMDCKLDELETQRRFRRRIDWSKVLLVASAVTMAISSLYWAFFK